MAVAPRRAVVVGGGSGIGAALVELQRDRGDDVVVWDVAGPRDHTCDITDTQAIDVALAATLGSGRVPDEVTVTAGIGHSGTLLDTPADDFDRVLGVNTRGVWLVMRAFARAMTTSGGGSIVVASSVSGRLADRGMGLYCASKAALDMLVRVAAVEWGPTGLRVNAVAPGVTDTPMLGGAPTDRGWLRDVGTRTALGGIGSPHDVARSILALHDEPWVTGQVLEVDGGLGLRSPIDPPGP